jgi:hypothetical protein
MCSSRVPAEPVGAKAPMRVPAWLAEDHGRVGRRAVDDRGPGRVQREGEARSALAADLAELARGVLARVGPDEFPGTATLIHWSIPIQRGTRA